MKQISIGQTTNADVYLDGNRLVGRVKEFKLDKVAYERVEHAALGMVGKAKLPGRQLEAIDAKISWIWLETAILLKTADPTRAVSLQFEKFVDVFDADGLILSEGYRILTQVKLLFAEEEMGAFKAGDDAVGVEHSCSVTRLMVKSTETDAFIREFDLFEGINRVNGKDVWPRY